jgi:ABC-type sugar transport system ATPase subunit
VQVLRGVNLDLFPGEVHALMGENGAGKSTLMKVLSGSYPFGSYEGQVWVDGRIERFSSPAEASDAGVSIIHQELSAFPDLTVAENLRVGIWPKRRGLVDWAKLESNATEWFKKIGIQIDPARRMGDLSVGEQQLVEIAKALSRDARILILDEPTSSLSPQESKRLFTLMRGLKAEGKALVYISHRMEEIFGQCNRATVLRDGQSVLTSPLPGITEAELIMGMVGRPLNRLFPEKKIRMQKDSPNLLEVGGFTATEKSTGRVLGPLSFTLAKGEILGFGGLLGAGRSELLQALLGDPRFHTGGSVIFNKKSRSWGSPRFAYSDGIVLVGEDRLRQSILPNRTIEENSSVLRLSLRGSKSLVNERKEKDQVLSELKKLRTNFSSLEQPVTELSGGNQQKAIFSRVLQVKPSVLILDEPTRGVDVGAKHEIYQILFELAGEGLGILLVSSDLPELMALSDRVTVLSEGKQKGTLAHSEIEENRIMSLAVGGRR